jgi:hypothetical protein
MAPRSKPKDPVEQIARSVELLLRLRIEALKGERSQTQMIRLLLDLGLESTEIASLLNLPGTTVAPEVSKMRAAEKKGTQNKRRKKRKV